MMQEDIALITPNFLPWAETAPPIFALNMQILGGPNWIWKGESPQWSCRRLWCPSHGQWGAGLCEGQQWGCSALGFSCTPQSPGIWDHDQPSVENRPFMLHFGRYFLEATGQEGQSLTDAEPGSLGVPEPQFWSCVAKQEGVAPTGSLKCHSAVADERTNKCLVLRRCQFIAPVFFKNDIYFSFNQRELWACFSTASRPLFHF